MLRITTLLCEVQLRDSRNEFKIFVKSHLEYVMFWPCFAILTDAETSQISTLGLSDDSDSFEYSQSVSDASVVNGQIIHSSTCYLTRKKIRICI